MVVNDFLDCFVFNNEATLLSTSVAEVHRHNACIWGSGNPHATVRQERDSSKVSVFCIMSKLKVYGPSFFTEKTLMGNCDLDMLQIWLFHQLHEEEPENFIWQQDGALPDFLPEV